MRLKNAMMSAHGRSFFLYSKIVSPTRTIIVHKVHVSPLKGKQDSSAPVEKDSSAPRHFGTVEKKCQIGTAFSFKYKLGVKIGKQEPGTPFSKLLDPRLMQQ
jgi:hypothetical protein